MQTCFNNRGLTDVSNAVANITNKATVCNAEIGGYIQHLAEKTKVREYDDDCLAISGNVFVYANERKNTFCQNNF